MAEGPDALSVMVDAQGIHHHRKIPFILLPEEYGVGKQLQPFVAGPSHMFLQKRFFPVGLPVPLDHPVDPAQKPHGVFRFLFVQFGPAYMVGGKKVQGVEEFLVRGIFPVIQHQIGFILPVPLGFRQQGGIQLVIQHVIPEPLVEIGQDPVVQEAVGFPESLQFLITVLGIFHPDLVQQFVYIKESIGQRGPFQLLMPEPGPPAEIPPELFVRKHPVGGIVMEYRQVVHGVILVIRRQFPLADEQFRSGLIPAGVVLFHGPELLEQRGQRFGRGPGLDGL